MDMMGEDVPGNWTTVKNNLAPLPIENGTYAVYEKAAKYLITALGGQDVAQKLVGGVKWWQVRSIDG